MIDGTNAWTGRVEIYYESQWGTVCDDRWDDRDAAVVCCQLGYSGGVAIGEATYGSGPGPILLDEVGCDGSESKLEDCDNWGWGVHGCFHYEDAGVRMW